MLNCNNELIKVLDEFGITMRISYNPCNVFQGKWEGILGNIEPFTFAYGVSAEDVSATLAKYISGQVIYKRDCVNQTLHKMNIPKINLE